MFQSTLCRAAFFWPISTLLIQKLSSSCHVTTGRGRHGLWATRHGFMTWSCCLWFSRYAVWAAYFSTPRDEFVFVGTKSFTCYAHLQTGTWHLIGCRSSCDRFCVHRVSIVGYKRSCIYAYNHTWDSKSIAIRPSFGMKHSGLNSNVSLLNGAVPATV
jgi:hypothetical protein